MLPREWKIFVLGREKTPLPNCAACHGAGPEHDREACPCLTCHGIYAGTNDITRIELMRERYPDNPWAVRTGAASGIIVLDAEGGGSPSGLEVLDDWETWTGWDRPLPWTERAAETPSGGVHLFYRYVEGVRSRNRVLPQVDIKADGGYVVIPINDDRRRWIREGDPAEPDPRLVDWFRSARGRLSGGSIGPVGHSSGYDYQRFLREGCPGGMRDEFFNELIFRLRKSGMERGPATVEIRRHWKQAAQPDRAVNGECAAWHMPWWNCEYKIDKIWRTVEPDDVSAELRTWAEAQRVDAPGIKRSRITTVPRGDR